MLWGKNITIPNTVRDIEQPALLYIAGENLKHCNHFGKQYGSFL